MNARSSDDGPLRPSDLPRVVAHRRALKQRTATPGEPSSRDARRRELAASSADLHRIDAMITANESRSQSPASALLWSLVVVAIAAVFVVGG